MRRYSANYIYPVIGAPIKNGVIVLDNSGSIVDIIDQGDSVKELHSTEFHNGIIVPGFVNAHCHLELSHLKGVLNKSTGIAGFVTQIRGLRRAEQGQIQKAIKAAVKDLIVNGTVAVGDICNTVDSIVFKKDESILFQNFIEQFGLSNDNAFEKFNQSKELLGLFCDSLGNCSSIVPHSTYSLSENLFELIACEIKANQYPISVHYGESRQEYQLLKDCSGPLADAYIELGIPLNLPDCKSPIEVVTKYIPKETKVLFVHNTFASREEVKLLGTYFRDSFFVLCPSSNLFIEGVLPDVKMIVDAGVKIALGTDSYASSDTLSVFDQMMILLNSFPSLSFQEVLNWATINGAKAFNFDSSIGSLEIGKKPGLNLITNFDFSNMRPTSKSRVKRLV